MISFFEETPLPSLGIDPERDLCSKPLTLVMFYSGPTSDGYQASTAQF